MANEHIEVENKRKDKQPERWYLVFYMNKEGEENHSQMFQSRQQAAEYIYILIQQGKVGIKVFQELPYRIQI